MENGKTDVNGKKEGKKRRKYYGSRTTKKGNTVTDYIAANALTKLYKGDILPIFTVKNGITPGKTFPRKLSAYRDKKNNLLYDYIVVDPENQVKNPPPKINPILKEASQKENDADKPLVFLVTTGLPHATIYVLYEKKMYTIGFGFGCEAPEPHSKLTNAMLHILRTVANYDASHKIDVLNGVLLSADKFQPVPFKDHPAKIVWVGFFNETICNELEKDLATVTNITYELDTKRIVKNTCSLNIPQKYCETASCRSNGTANCILWAQQKLGISIDCGLINHPYYCAPVLKREYKELVANINKEDIKKIVSVIQSRLTTSTVKKFTRRFRLSDEESNTGSTNSSVSTQHTPSPTRKKIRLTD